MNLKLSLSISMPMGIFINKRSITLLEIVIALSLALLILPGLIIGSYSQFQKIKYEQDVLSLKADLQMAHDIALHTQSPVNIFLEQTQKGLVFKIGLENVFLQRKIHPQNIYPHIHQFKSNDHIQSRLHFLCTFSGALEKDLLLSFNNHKIKKSYYMKLQGYPHVIELFD